MTPLSHPRGLLVSVGLAISLLVAHLPGFAAASDAPAFALPKWETGETVTLSDFAGKIVVLDFFAYWCAPCKRASEEIERGIQRHYAGAKGHPQDVPVQVVAINIEKDNPKLTAQFIEQTGAEFVLNDFDGTLLARLGGAATPFLVVIDGSRATKESPDFRVLYSHAGFEGTKKLRQIIDRVTLAGTASASPRSTDRAAAVVEKAGGSPTTRKGEVSFDAMLASDVQVTSTALRYGEQRGGTEWDARFTYNSIAEDYKPFTDFDQETLPRSLYESYFAGQVKVRQKLMDSLALSASGGVYDGFTDFRSLWFSEYYRQRFNILPEYFASDPQGFNAGAGLRWEYQPTTGFVEANFLYAYDQIPPGWDRVPAPNPALPELLLHGREILHTYAPSIKFENVLAKRLRAWHEFQLTLTSARQPRYSYRGDVNVALGERWVGRVSGGYAHEDPTLRAWHVGATLEFEIAPQWLVNVSGIYYRDTGEIENSTRLSTAAPGLRTWQTGLGLRYVGERAAFSLSASPMWSDYEPLESGTLPLTNLYRDRTWVLVQAAWSIEL